MKSGTWFDLSVEKLDDDDDDAADPPRCCRVALRTPNNCRLTSGGDCN